MRTRKYIPWLTLAMVGLAVAASVIPALSRWLVFDRAAIIGGQWWRLVTGNWVHFSTDHLLADTLALLMAGWLIEHGKGSSVLWICGAAALVVGLTVLFLEPTIARYGGLSGVDCAAVGYLGAAGITKPGARRWLFIIVLTLLVTKTAWEYATGHLLFVKPRSDTMILPLAHAAGVVSGLACWVATAVWRQVDVARTERGDARCSQQVSAGVEVSGVIVPQTRRAS